MLFVRLVGAFRRKSSLAPGARIFEKTGQKTKREGNAPVELLVVTMIDVEGIRVGPEMAYRKTSHEQPPRTG